MREVAPLVDDHTSCREWRRSCSNSPWWWCLCFFLLFFFLSFSTLLWRSERESRRTIRSFCIGWETNEGIAAKVEDGSSDDCGCDSKEGYSGDKGELSISPWCWFSRRNCASCFNWSFFLCLMEGSCPCEWRPAALMGNNWDGFEATEEATKGTPRLARAWVRDSRLGLFLIELGDVYLRQDVRLAWPKTT